MKIYFLMYFYLVESNFKRHVILNGKVCNITWTIYQYHLGCENLKEELVRADNGLNDSYSANLCICTDDIHSKTDVWQEVIDHSILAKFF